MIKQKNPGIAVLLATGKDRYTDGFHTITATREPMTAFIKLQGWHESWFVTDKIISTIDMSDDELEKIILYVLAEMFEQLNRASR